MFRSLWYQELYSNCRNSYRIFAKRVFVICATNASFLRGIAILQIKKIPSKLEVAPYALGAKCLSGVEWMDGYPLDCYDY